MTLLPNLKRLFFYGLAASLSHSVVTPIAYSAPNGVPDTMVERTRACAACHGAQGEGSDNAYFPRLAGQPADYLFEQLVQFREGKRTYRPMNYLVTYLSDDYLKKMADYFSIQSPPKGRIPTKVASNQPSIHAAKLATDTQSIALRFEEKRAQQLIFVGDAKRHIPACTTCHGTTLTGMQAGAAQPAIPGLIGLGHDYIQAQLGAWRARQRHSASPDCMHSIATALDEQDIRALAGWIAKQPTPANWMPAPAHPLPLKCGSIGSIRTPQHTL